MSFWSGAGAGLLSGGASYLAGGSARSLSKSQYNLQKKLIHWGPYYQVKALERAGLNPILAAGGMAGLQGRQPGIVGAPPQFDVGQAVTRGMQSKLMDQQAKQSAAQVSVLTKQVEKMSAEIENIRENTKNTAQNIQLKAPMADIMSLLEGFFTGPVSGLAEEQARKWNRGRGTGQPISKPGPVSKYRATGGGPVVGMPESFWRKK